MTRKIEKKLIFFIAAFVAPQYSSQAILKDEEVPPSLVSSTKSRICAIQFRVKGGHEQQRHPSKFYCFIIINVVNHLHDCPVNSLATQILHRYPHCRPRYRFEDAKSLWGEENANPAARPILLQRGRRARLVCFRRSGGMEKQSLDEGID